MYLKPEAPEIDSAAPFAGDLMGREQSATVLTQLIDAQGGRISVGLESPEQSGKTTFLAMWQAQLVKDGRAALYCDLSQTDHMGAPLVAVLGSIATGIEALGLPATMRRRLVRHLDRMKLLTPSLVGGAKAVEAANPAEQFEQCQKATTDFRHAFGDLVNVLADTGDTNKPVILMVDGIDACKPSYAVEALKTLGSLYGATNAVVVTAYDRNTLADQIKVVYGAGINFERYLRRHVDVQYQLPVPVLSHYAQAVFVRSGLARYFSEVHRAPTSCEGERLAAILSELYTALELSCAQQRQCFFLMAVIVSMTPINGKLYPLLLATLVAVKVKNPELYAALVNDQAGPRALVAYISEHPVGGALLASDYGATLEAYIMSSRGSSGNIGELSTPYTRVANCNEAKAEERTRAVRILRHFESFELNDVFGQLGHLSKKIEMAANFSH